MKYAELGKVADVNWGDTSVTKASYVEKGYPAYSATGNDGFLPYFDFERDGIVLSAIGARCGKTWFATGKWSVIKNTIRFWSESSELDNRYLYWLTADPDFWPKRGAAQPFITIGDARKQKIPLPPLEEQERIAAILDQADELRRKRQRALDRVNQLGQAIFIEMFGDPKTNPNNLPWVTLGEVAAFYSGNSLPEGEPFSGRDDGHLLLKVSDLNHPLNQHDIICAASWSAAPGSRAGTCPREALIFPKRGGAIGTNKKRWLRRSAILDPNLMGVHPDQSRLTMSFLLAWFETFNLSDIASGSSVPQLNKQDLAPLQLALPPLDEQIAFAERMDEITSMRVNVANAHSCGNRLFDVLQHHAFRGELTTSSLKEAAA